MVDDTIADTILSCHNECLGKCGLNGYSHSFIPNMSCPNVVLCNRTSHTLSRYPSNRLLRSFVIIIVKHHYGYLVQLHSCKPQLERGVSGTSATVVNST